MARRIRSLARTAAILASCWITVGRLAAQEVVIYQQDYNGFPDGTTDLKDGSVMAGTANIVEGQLQMTTDSPVNMAAFWIPPSPASADGWVAEFDYSISDESPSPPADGFSFNYGAVPAGVLSEFAEEGFPGVEPVISFEVDTWINGGPEVGPAISVNNVDIPGGFTNGDMLADDTSITGSIKITLQQDATTSFTSTGALTNAQFLNLASGFTPDGSFAFALAARTGGASEEIRIDNLRITSIFLVEPATSVEPISSVTLTSGGLRLTIPTATRRRIGIEYSPDLSPGSWIELGNAFELERDPTFSAFTDPDAIRLGRTAGFYRAFLRPPAP